MRKDYAIWIAILITILLIFSTYLYPSYETQQRTRFVLFSCLHVGETSEKQLKRAANYTKSLDPDYVISVGDFLSQEHFRWEHEQGVGEDAYMKRYLKFLEDIGMEPEVNVFHVAGGVHDGWDGAVCRYYDGLFRMLGKYSDMDMVKIGNLAFIFLSEVRGGENYRVTRSQLGWLESKVEELSLQGYNIFLVKHTSLYRTTAYTDQDGDSKKGAWTGVDTSANQEESKAIKSIVNQHDNVIMIIQGHVHIDAMDEDEVGRKAYMNWKEVVGDPHYLGIEAHVLNCAGISTTMHGKRYKSYQNIWYMDFAEGESYLHLYAHNIKTGQELLHYRISLKRPYESGQTKYEQQWSPCYLDYPKIDYPNSLTDTYKIYINAGKRTHFKSKFKFDKPITVTDIDIIKSGDGSINKTIAYSSDGINFSEFSSNLPVGSYKYWMVNIDVIAETQVEIQKLELITRFGSIDSV